LSKGKLESPSNNEIIAHLSLIDGIKPEELNFLVANYGKDLSQLVTAPPILPEDISLDIWEKLFNIQDLSSTQQLLKDLKKQNIHCIDIYTKDFPDGLKNRNEFPPIIWIKESLPIELLTKSVAIIGSHNATQYGMNLAWQIASHLAKKDIFIISGGALGIDQAAHFGSLAVNKSTLVILPMGIKTYLAKLASTFEYYEQEQKAVIFSQFHPDSPWLAENALSRNLAIALLAKAVVVIEAKGWRSGTMSTVNHAKQLGKPIFVVKHHPSLNADWAHHTLPKHGIAIPLNSDQPWKELIRYLIDLNCI
jgi:DNA processing protein